MNVKNRRQLTTTKKAQVAKVPLRSLGSTKRHQEEQQKSQSRSRTLGKNSQPCAKMKPAESQLP